MRCAHQIRQVQGMRHEVRCKRSLAVMILQCVCDARDLSASESEVVKARYAGR
jgi:hypothetical protein